MYFIFFYFFFFNDTATPEIYTLSLHDALPISDRVLGAPDGTSGLGPVGAGVGAHLLENRVDEVDDAVDPARSEEHTSELQSRPHLVCRLLLEKKKKEGDKSTTHSGKCNTHL